MPVVTDREVFQAETSDDRLFGHRQLGSAPEIVHAAAHVEGAERRQKSCNGRDGEKLKTGT